MLMKKTLLLVMLTAFASLAATAQVVLGDVKWSIRDGAKVNPAKTITIQFPNINGVDGTATISLAGNLFAEGEEATEDNAFDGIEANVLDPVAFPLADFEVVENTSYTLKITSVKVDGVEAIGDTTFVINFKTRGGERKLSWTFTIDGESVKKIHADDKNEDKGSGQYWSVVTKDTRHYYHVKTNYDEMMLDANTVLPMTEGLTFTANADKIYVGDTVTTTYKENLVFNTNHLYVTVPDCKVGDVVAFTAVHASANKPSKNKFASIMSQYGTAVAVDGFVSEQATNPDGVADSITLNGTKTAYKFEVQEDGDITFKLSNARLYSITITEGVAKVPCKYSAQAVYKDGDNVKVLKELVSETDGITGTTVKVNYSYWLTDEDGNLYTHGAKGTPFVETLDLVSDTIFHINYTKADITGVVFLAEAEDFYDEEDMDCPVKLCTQANAAIRSSNCKAAYTTADTKLITLPAGTYKMTAIIFDNTGKTSGRYQKIAVGTTENDTLFFSATADNWTEAENIFELKEETDIVWAKGGADTNGFDCFVIYATDELPEPDYVLGDVNGDNEITMADANAVVNYFLASDTEKAQMIENNFNVEAADVITDGDITMADANAIVNIFLGVAGEGEKE